VSRSGCGHFGGYVGEIGGYWDVNNCIGSDAFSTSAANRANTNLYSYGYGIGAQSYFFAAGPGMDPNYDGTTSEAHDWGVKQAKIAVAEAADYSMVREILVIDVEDGTAAPYTGWNETTTACGALISSSACCATDVARATINAFNTYVFDDTSFWPAYYSAPGIWAGILGSGTDATLSNTMEWTADYKENCHQPGPYSWTQDSGSCSSNSATFFGTVTTGNDCAFMWQWSGGQDDYDQIDANRETVCH
jgi:hypothetical protein